MNALAALSNWQNIAGSVWAGATADFAIDFAAQQVAKIWFGWFFTRTIQWFWSNFRGRLKII